MTSEYIMSFLDDLTIQKCCYCINLKIGCYIIAILSIIILVPSTSGAVASCYEGTSTIRTIQGLGVFLLLLAVASGIFFIYGLFMEVRLPTMVYMAVLVVAIVITLLAAILIVTQTPNRQVCPDSVALGASGFVEVGLQIYCFIIVNSYRVLIE